ncbi:MAG: nucleotidyltransferase domain-containing protein [Coriobacteriia bacterium]|nr:nucleotidyltransferase domain-containing protein [Coriobacteriia bacterium]
MTNQHPRSVPAPSSPELAALLDEVARGVTITLVRDGRPVAVLSPPADADALESSVIARESRAAYAPLEADRAQPATAILRLVGGVGARSVLGVFVKDPERAVHQREIARRAGVGLRSAQLALERLESLGLITSERDGNRRYYRANRSGRFEELRGLLGREFGLAGVIAASLEGFGDRIAWAFIFGSAAEGRDTVESDVDLFVVGEVTRDELVPAIAQAQRDAGREIDLVLYRPHDLVEKRAQGNHFITAALAGPRIDVIGSANDA